MIDRVSWGDVEELCINICDSWSHEGPNWGKPPDRVIGLARGGLVPATIIAHQLGVRTVYSHGYHSYDDKSKDRVQHGTMYQDCVEGLWYELSDGDTILVVDDLCDEGITMSGMVERLYQKFLGDITVKTAALYCKEHSSFRPDYIGKVVGNNWLAFPWERRDVAQSGSASALGAEGRGFESLHPDQNA